MFRKLIETKNANNLQRETRILHPFPRFIKDYAGSGNPNLLSGYIFKSRAALKC